MRHRGTAAFTLVELLVVIAIVGAITAALIAGLRSSKGATLQNAQATLANVLTSARIKASSTGCRVRVLINADVNNPARFRRMLVVQQEDRYKSGEWSIVAMVVTLPEGVAILPYKDREPTNFYEASASWKKTYGSDKLHSSALYQPTITCAVQSATEEIWDSVQFTPGGTMTYGNGDIVIAHAFVRTPGSYEIGEAPLRVELPDSVRGVSISTYGVVAMVNSRSGF